MPDARIDTGPFDRDVKFIKQKLECFNTVDILRGRSVSLVFSS